MSLDLQIIRHPSNAIAKFVSSEMDWVVALADEEHNEAIRTKGMKRVLVLDSKLGSPINARVLTIRPLHRTLSTQAWQRELETHLNGSMQSSVLSHEVFIRSNLENGTSNLFSLYYKFYCLWF